MGQNPEKNLVTIKRFNGRVLRFNVQGSRFGFSESEI
jgi:hypothetical protein